MNKFVRYILPSLVLVMLCVTSAFSQGTFTWTGSVDTNWENASNWSPTRTITNTGDVLVFNGLQTNQPSDTISHTVAAMIFTGNTIVSFQNRVGNVKITCTGSTPDAFHIDSSVTVYLTSSSANTPIDSICLPYNGPGGHIYGTLGLTGRVGFRSYDTTKANNSRLYFESGSNFIDSTASGNPFGTSAVTATANGVEFLAGSSLTDYRGSNAFALAAPLSQIIMDRGSWYRAKSSNTPSMSGRHYANLELNVNDQAFTPFYNVSISIGAYTTVDTIQLSAAAQGDTLNFTGAGILRVNGSIINNLASNNVLTFASPVYFDGDSTGITQQTIANTGTLTFTGGDSIGIGSTVHLLNTISMPSGKVSYVYGTLNPDTATVTGAGGITVASGGDLQVKASTYAGNYTYSGTTTLNSGSTVEYAGSTAQTVDQTKSYSNLKINNASGASLNGTTTVSKALNLASGTLGAGANTLTLSGTGTVVTGTPGNFSAGTGTVNYTGASATNVAAMSYNNLNLNGGTTYSAVGSFGVGGTMAIASGATFDPTSNFTVTGGSLLDVSGNLNVDAATYAGNYTGFTTTTFENLSSAVFQGGVAQTVGANSYYNLTLNNGSGATQSGDVTVSNTLTLTSGTYSIGANALTLSNPISGTATHLVGGSSSSLNLNGTSTLAIPSSVTELNNLTSNTTGGSSISAGLQIDNELNIASSSSINDNGQTISIAGQILVNNGSTSGGGEVLLSSALANKLKGRTRTSGIPGVVITGTGSFDNLEVNGGQSPEATFSGVSTINGTLTLTAGAVNNTNSSLIMGSGSTISRAAGSLSAAPTYGTSENVMYTGSGATVTSYEMPTAAYLNNFTVNNSGGVTLGSSATVNGTLTLTSGAFNIGANTLTLSSAIGGTATNLAGTSSSTLSIAGSSAFSVPSSLTTLGGITLNNAGGASLNANLSVAGTVAVNAGQLSTGSYTVNLGSTGMLAEAGYGAIVLGNVTASGTISSKAAKKPLNKKTMSVPDNIGNLGLDIEPNGGTVPGATTVTRVTGTPESAAGTSGIARYYTVSAGTMSGLNATVNFYYDSTATELNGRTQSLFDLFESPTGASPWSNYGYTTRDTTDHILSVAGVTNLGTFTVSDSLNPLATSASQNSDVVVLAGSESSTISSLTNDASPLSLGTGTQVWSVVIRDGGSSAPDADDKATTLATMTLTQGTGNQVANWSNAINAADLFQGATHLASGTVGATSISFSNIGATAPDNGNDTIQLRISLKNPLGSGVADHQHFDFAVTNANVQAASSLTSSQFGSFSTISSDNTKNQIQVIATALHFSTEPPSTSKDLTNFSASVSGSDANGNPDSDYTGSVTLGVGTGTGSFSAVSGLTKSAVAGTASWSDLVYNKVESGVTVSASGTGGVSSTASTSIAFTQRVDSLSDVVANNGEASTVSSIINDNGPLDATHGVQVWSVLIRDGGASGNDADDLPTTITSLTLTQDAANTVPNWANAINAADLFDGATHLASGTVASGSISFTGFSSSAPDNGTKALSVRISIKNPLGAGVQDDQKFVFDVTAANVTATAGTTSSQFATGWATGSNSSKDILAVVATQFVFNAPIGNQKPSTNFSAAVTATDVNGNRDYDFANTVTFSANGPGALSGGMTPTAVSGVASSSTLQIATNGTYTLSANATGGLTGTSASFVVAPITTWKVAGTIGDTANWDSASTWHLISGTSSTGVPARADQVILDNTFKSGSYVIEVGKTVTDSCTQLTIGYANNPNPITLLIPNEGQSQVSPSLVFGDNQASDYDIEIDSNGIFQNSIGDSNIFSNNMYWTSTTDSIHIAKGGTFIENNLMNQTFFARNTRALDGNYGTVVFDIPPGISGAFDINADNTWFPNLEFKNSHGGNTHVPYYLYAGSTTGTTYIKGNLVTDPGARDSLGTADAIAIFGNIINNSGANNSKFTNSPVLMWGRGTQTISGYPTTFGAGLIATDTVNVQTNITVSGGAVQTSGTFAYNYLGGTDSNANVNGPLVVTTGDTLSLDPAGSLSEAGNPVQGAIEAQRVAAQNANQAFGSIGFQLNGLGGAPGLTKVVRRNTFIFNFNGNHSIARSYDVTPTNNTSLNATMVFGYAPSELDSITETSLLLNKTSNGGTTWSGQSGTVNTSLHQITALGVQSVGDRWTATSSSAPLFITHTYVVRKYADVDGNFNTTGDDTGKKWHLYVYAGDTSAANLVNSGNPLSGVLTTSNLGAGTYIAQEADSTSSGWLTLGKVHSGTRIAGTAKYDTLTFTDGGGASTDSTDFINTHTASIAIAKFRNTTGNPAIPGNAKNWQLSLYKDSVNAGHLIATADTSYLYTSNLVAGHYIATEADSGAAWERLNGNQTRFDTLTLAASQAIADTFDNFTPNYLNVVNLQDHDGNFSTTNDRTQLAWHVEVHKDSVGGALVASSDSGHIVLTGLGDGTYVAVESDSTGWVRLGIVPNGPWVPGTADNFSVTLTGGQSGTVFFVQASPAYSTKYRTFTSNAIATSMFGKKTAVPVTKKTDKYQFSTSLVTTNDSTNGLYIVFGSAVDTSYAFAVTGATAKSADSKLEKWTISFPSVNHGDTVTVSGFSANSQKISEYYFTKGGVEVGTTVKKNIAITNAARLPMPNAVNAVEQAFTDGAFTGGLLIGKDHSTDGLKKKYGWVLAAKYTDVMASLYAKGSTQNAAAHGFDVNLKSKALAGKYKSLAPTTYNSDLFGDLLALKVNIAASAMGITTPGLGQLVYQDTSSESFNGLTLDSIAAAGDTIMEGYYNLTAHDFSSVATFARFDSIVSYINNAFNGAIDTVAFGDSLVFTGVNTLESATFLHSTGVSAAKTKGALVQSVRKPVAYKLYQNYPNPFNPTTTIQFDLPEKSTVTLKVYNILGQEVTTLFNHATLNAGTQVTRFNASNYASGVYFYRIIATSAISVGKEYTKVEKMMLIK